MTYRKRPCNVCGVPVTTNALGRRSHVRACYAKDWRAAVAAFGGLVVGDTLRIPGTWLRDKTLRIARISSNGATAEDLRALADGGVASYGIGPEYLRKAVRLGPEMVPSFPDGVLMPNPDRPLPIAAPISFPDSRVRALIGPTGYGSFGIVWRNFPQCEELNGQYSGPFDTLQQAEERAVDITLHYGAGVPQIERVENVNRLPEGV